MRGRVNSIEDGLMSSRCDAFNGGYVHCWLCLALGNESINAWPELPHVTTSSRQALVPRRKIT